MLREWSDRVPGEPKIPFPDIEAIAEANRLKAERSERRRRNLYRAWRFLLALVTPVAIDWRAPPPDFGAKAEGSALPMKLRSVRKRRSDERRAQGLFPPSHHLPSRRMIYRERMAQDLLVEQFERDRLFGPSLMGHMPLEMLLKLYLLSRRYGAYRPISIAELSAAMSISPGTYARWVEAFAEHGLASLHRSEVGVDAVVLEQTGIDKIHSYLDYLVELHGASDIPVRGRRRTHAELAERLGQLGRSEGWT